MMNASDRAKQTSGISTATSQGILPGTAYVEYVGITRTGSAVRLNYPAGRSVLVVLDSVPNAADYRVPAGFNCLLAVSVRLCRAQVECTVLGTSHWGYGPRRASVSLAQAL